MKKRTLLAFASIAYLVAVLLFASGGHGNVNGAGDGNEEYDSGGSCHTTPGTGTITAVTSTPNPTTGQSITVTVTVTATALSSQKLVGVFLVRALQTSNSQPSVDGWIILSDPNGGANNYVEKTAVSVGTPTDFVWTVKAPATPGTYRLYARAHHGATPTAALFLDFTTGLTFNVQPPGAGAPAIEHQPPQSVRPGVQTLIEATMRNATRANLTWKNSEMASSLQVSMTNTSTQRDSGWLYQAVIPAQDSPTQITYEINATSATGIHTTASYSFAVTEPPPTRGVSWEKQVEWILTTIAIGVAICGVVVLAHLLFKRKLRKGK